MITILIPTYNNLNYLKLCIKSIQNNSSTKYRIILHINEGSDGTLNYANERNLEYTFSKKNIGLSASINTSCKTTTWTITLLTKPFLFFIGMIGMKIYKLCTTNGCWTINLMSITTLTHVY